MISGNEAIDQIEREFSGISRELRENDGLLHIQTAEFSHLVQGFIDSGNSAEFGRACDLFVRLFLSASPELENALNVSFLEHLYFIDDEVNRSWAYAAMPPPMRKAWDAMEEYNDRLHP
ncbi:MAG: hypothetical protein WDZ30_09780 [Cellvibrionaceae bacterium]